MPTIQQRYPVNIQPEDKPVFDVAFEHQVPAPELLVYENCWWNPFTGKEIKGYRAKLRFLIISVIKQRPIKKIAKAAWVTDHYSANYFHWVNDVLPKIIYLRHNNIDCPVIIPEEFARFNYIIASLELLNIPYLLWQGKSVYIIGRLLLPQVGASGSQDLFYFPLLRQKLMLISHEVMHGKKIFISRQKANNRKIVNFDATEKIMIARGFEIVYPETLTFIEQMAVFSSATHLIGIHGAGLTNMIFMGPGCRVLEIRRENDYWNYCYYFMASTLKLEYYYFMAAGAGVSELLQADDFLIDSGRLGQTLDDFLKDTI